MTVPDRDDGPPDLLAAVRAAENLQRAGRNDDAVDAYRKLLPRLGGNPSVLANFGEALRRYGALDEAESVLRRAVALAPGKRNCHLNLGMTLQDLGRLEEAVAAYEEALRIDPDYAEARWNLSHVLLHTGAYERGWALYESRWGMERSRADRRHMDRPRWGGETLADGTLLLWAEQGLGDTLQFVRYAEIARQRVRRVVLQVQAPLASLCRSVAGVDQVIVDREPPPAFDAQLPLLSLPRVLGTTLADIPRNVPYVSPDPGKLAYWRSRLERRALNVGLTWSSKARGADDEAFRDSILRSVTLSQLAPLATRGVAFYSLQKGPAAVEAGQPPLRMSLHDWSDELRDFSDTAALAAALDLVISVDTAVAHVAGALAVPVWVLLRRTVNWRWLRGEDTTPWYPTMRLFRQEEAADWRPVIGRVAAALHSLVQDRRPARRGLFARLTGRH
jgi:tetratricopeptide (TPR) repeat protein